MDKVIIIGGGLSGLASAYFLQQQGVPSRLLEAAPQVGGNLLSIQENGFLRDAGPNSLMIKGQVVPALIESLQLEQEIIEANPLAKRRYILNRKRQLVPLGPGVLFSGKLLSLQGRLRLLSEAFRGRGNSAVEESIATFVRRRLGPEVLTWLVDPFVSGVFAGDPERLAVAATFPRLVKMEQEHGSLFRAALAARKNPKNTKPRLISFRKGLQALPLRMAERLEGPLHCNAPVDLLQQHKDGSWEVFSQQQSWRSEKIILALPAHKAAALLATLQPTLAAELEAISYPAVTTLSIGFPRHSVEHPLDGFGMLIPRTMGLETLGVLFSSTLFPDRADPEQVLMTAFIGGSQNPLQGRSDSDLLQTVLREIQPILGITGEPSFSRCQNWPEAIPQYESGHLARLERIAKMTDQIPGLYFRANWSDGVALGDCMEAARQLSQKLAN
ncbi:protoporphyrinogen oxidase [Acidithiobacillus concretivorus]|uniref:Protoporphyrinogen oxidase n=1 Tax=Acidithiobacillus concretivorus TaxID=3063952 RepID=A0ABS5ZSJ1_9PROT|nr:protoporphyrinogen oxidase [Acidithiobacillus concretivorus]MBU2739475.1 protoporphyrinogen oxidase [Acidithiobacillus concretivorus]